MKNEFEKDFGILKNVFGILKDCFRILKRMVPYSLQTRVLIIVAAVTLHNYIKRETHKDLLFEECGNNKMIVINSDDNDEKE